MEKLTALLLTLAMLLGVISTPKGDANVSGGNGGLISQITQPTTPEEPLPPNTAVVTSAASLYSSYNKSTRTLAQLKKGDTVRVLQKATYSSTAWAYVCAKDYNVCGWMLQSVLELPNGFSDSELYIDEITEEYVPTYAQMGTVSSDQLNIRTAPGTNFAKVGAYRGGDRVGIIETNSGWGRTAKGWIYLEYVYMDGQVGRNPMIGTVTAAQLNIRSGPGTDYPIRSSYAKGTRLIVLEQVYVKDSLWGCTRQGWVSMSYVQPDCIPGTNRPIYGYGTIRDKEHYVYPTTDKSGSPVWLFSPGDVTAILEVVQVGATTWGHILPGWIDMSNVDMRAVYSQANPPAPPVMPAIPVTPPTEPLKEEPTMPTLPNTETATAPAIS